MKLKIAAKVNLLVIIALILLGGTSVFLSVSALKSGGKLAIDEYRTGMMNEKRTQIKDLVNSAYSVIKTFHDAKEGTEAQRQQLALDAIQNMRYGENDTGYFFIFDSKAVTILHAAKPQLKGKSLWDLKKEGIYPIRELVNTASNNVDGGYFKYLWEKPGASEPLAKLSFARKFNAWDWNIGTGVYTDDVDQAITKKEETIQHDISSQIIKVISIIVAIIVIALIGCYIVVGKGIVGPIKKMINMLRDIAEGEGDLTRRIEDKSGDETQELAEWFNKFIENMQDMISDVKADSARLTDSSENLAGISDQMNIAAEDTASRANTVAAASEEMSVNMNSVAAAMEEAATNMSMVASASEEMSSTIDEIAQNAEKARSITENAVTQTESASSQVNELGAAAREIGQVVESITDISNQVNLLALNATIEAARAGEAGKGFAVVANEIKDLASQTAQATGEIKSRVEGIQASTDGTINEISNISSVVTEITEIVSTIATAVEEQSVTTREIAENVSQASMGIGEVNENVSQGSTATQDVAQEIAEVTQSSGEMANSSSQVKMNAEDLSELAQNLTQLMEKFKV